MACAFVGADGKPDKRKVAKKKQLQQEYNELLAKHQVRYWLLDIHNG
jgi:hypothetical protein